MNNQQTVVSAALRAVGNIVTGDDIQTQVTFSSCYKFRSCMTVNFGGSYFFRNFKNGWLNTERERESEGTMG